MRVLAGQAQASRQRSSTSLPTWWRREEVPELLDGQLGPTKKKPKKVWTPEN